MAEHTIGMVGGPRPMAAGPGPVAGIRPMAGAVGPLARGLRPMTAGPGPAAGIHPAAGAVGPLAGGPRPIAGVRPIAGATGPATGGPRPFDPGTGNNLFMDLHPGMGLGAGDNLFSLKGAFVLTLQQSDGNLVLYAFNDWDGRLDVPLWSLLNDGVNLPLQNPVAVMQTDGNFVVYAEYPTYPGNFYPAWNT